MGETTQRIGGFEPSVKTVEMVCERLAELGLAIGPDTARVLVRDVLAAEGPRIDARLRESIDTALQTIKVAAQSAMGLLATTGGEQRTKEPPAPEQLHVSRKPPAQAAAQPAARKPAAAPPAEPRKPEPRPSGPRHRPRVDFEEDERRPMFRRPGRR